MKLRAHDTIVEAPATREGAGFLVHRSFPIPELEMVDRYLMLQLFAAYGITAGVVMGILEIRAIYRGRALSRVEKKRVAERAERERLEYLNQYLRHEVLNDVQIVLRYTGLLRQRFGSDSKAADWAGSIELKADEITEFIQSIRTILDEGADEDPGSVEVVSLLERSVRKVCTHYPDATVSVQGPDAVDARANDVVETAFTNLIENAIQHNDGFPRLDVRVEPGPDAVRVHFADNGPGIDDDARADLYAPPEAGDHGYGLFLTRKLVELNGGSVWLERTSERGSEFVVELATVPETARTAETRAVA